MEILEKRLDEIQPYENNPRNNDGAVEAVSKSIKEFGFKVPIVIDSNGVIVTGHTRYKACQLLGITKVPCVVADDLTEAQIKAFRLVDNKVAEEAGWDFDKLDEELAGLACLDELDMTDFGFTDISNTDLEDLFTEDNTEPKNKEPKKIICPHCGKEIEL